MQIDGPTLDGRRTAMTRRGLRLALLAAVVVALAPVTAFAQTGTIADWGPDCYAYESNFNTATYISSPGDQLRIVGIVNSFAGVLSALNANDPNTEYTVWIKDLVSAGTAVSNTGGFARVHRTAYGPGAIEIWRGSPRDAAFGTNPPNATVPSTFTNGTLFLGGSFDSLVVAVTIQNSNNFVLSGNADSGEPTPTNGQFTGGDGLSLVSAAGAPCPFRVTGGWLERPGNFPAGYMAHFDGKLDINCPTPAAPSTWGRIKGQYRL
jgi:hypothetical protein